MLFDSSHFPKEAWADDTSNDTRDATRNATANDTRNATWKPSLLAESMAYLYHSNKRRTMNVKSHIPVITSSLIVFVKGDDPDIIEGFTRCSFEKQIHEHFVRKDKLFETDTTILSSH